MGTISVSMSGARVFSWEGDERVVKNILEESPRGARGVGMEPAAMAEHCIRRLETGPQDGRAARPGDDDDGGDLVSLGDERI
jgi:hypothetical protein